jgi:hypothetical protein
MKRNPVLLVMSIFAGLQALSGGAFLLDVFGAKTAGLVVLALAAVQAGVQYWVRGQVTPLADPRDNLGRPMRTGSM